jgi:hypothetical protein
MQIATILKKLKGFDYFPAIRLAISFPEPVILGKEREALG